MDIAETVVDVGPRGLGKGVALPGLAGRVTGEALGFWLRSVGGPAFLDLGSVLDLRRV